MGAVSGVIARWLLGYSSSSTNMFSSIGKLMTIFNEEMQRKQAQLQRINDPEWHKRRKNR